MYYEEKIINDILRNYHPADQELEENQVINNIRKHLNIIDFDKYVYNSPIGYFLYEHNDDFIYKVSFIKKIIYN